MKKFIFSIIIKAETEEDARIEMLCLDAFDNDWKIEEIEDEEDEEK